MARSNKVCPGESADLPDGTHDSEDGTTCILSDFDTIPLDDLSCTTCRACPLV